MPFRLWAALAGVVASLGLLTWSHTHAYRAGQQAERVARLEADVKAYETREGIEHEVDSMDRYRVCLDLGGLPDDCGKLRGVAEAAAGE